MKKILAVLAVVLAVAVVGCAKKTNPMGPSGGLPDAPQPTATPVGTTPGKSTVVVKTLTGNQPLSNVACTVKFDGIDAIPSTTDSTGTATLVIDGEGNYVATIPAQGDILLSTLTGYCKRGDSNVITFQAAGGAVSMTPTAIQYNFTGGTYKLLMTYLKGASSLNFKGAPTIVNIPATWTATTALPQIADGIGNTLTVVIPSGATENCLNLLGRLSAQGNAINVDSTPFIMARNWTEYADIKVSVQNGTVGMANINFTVTDSAGTSYPGITDSNGTKTIRINKTGNYSVRVPAQGLVLQNDRNGVVAQAELKTVPIQVGSADISGVVTMDGAAWGSLPMIATDANGKTYTGTTMIGTGQYSFHLDAIGPYTVGIQYNPAWGILATNKSGTVAQNGAIPVNFSGTKGSIWISIGGVGYPYIDYETPMTVTYVNSGEIKFTVNISHAPALPAPGAATLTQAFDTLQLTNNQSTTSRYHNSQAITTAYNGCTISLTKPGDKGFTLTTGGFNVAPDWWVEAQFTCPNPNGMHKDGPSVDTWSTDYNVSFTLIGHNVPTGTLLNAVIAGPQWPQSYPCAGWVGSAPVPYGSQLKYFAGLTPDENMTPRTLTGQRVGDSHNFQIRGMRNSAFGTSRCDDGKYTVRVNLGEVSRTTQINFSY